MLNNITCYSNLHRTSPLLTAALFLAGAATGLAQVVGDNFSAAIPLAGEAGTLAASNVGATSEPGEPNHSETAGGHSVWYSWTTLATGGVAFDTAGSGFDTVLAVYTGVSVDALTLVAANNDIATNNTTSRVVFRAVAGTTYRIAVDGASSNSGSYVLTWRRGSPANDDFAGAQTFSVDSGQINGSTYFATRETGEPLHFNDNPGGHSVWFRWTAPADAQLSVDTFGSGFDTLLALYTGASLTGLSQIASSDDYYEFTTNKASKVLAPVTAGTTYYIALDGFNGDSGGFVLNWSATVTLEITAAATNQVRLSWPATSQGFNLVSSRSPQNTNAWTAVTNQMVLVSNKTTVTIAQQAIPAFYRLQKP